MKKILLIDADSKIPNLSLMKLSTYHKNKGDQVEVIKLNIPYFPNKKKEYFYAPDKYDIKYCSVIFNDHEKYIKGNDIIFGGTGTSDIKKTLPKEVENLSPDYSLYPDNNYSYGFITRGCSRNCSFCYVPKKEGMIRKVSTIDEVVNHKITMFMDNNILAYHNHKEVFQELIDKKIKHQFNQGLDIRLIDEENSTLLSKLNYYGDYLFAFDNVKYEKIINEKISLMDWRKDWKFKFFVYVHPDMSLSETVYRIEWLRGNKCLPYIMRDITCWESEYSEFYIDLAAYCNQPNLIRKMTFNEFLDRRHKNKKRVFKHKELYNRGMN